MTCFISLDEIFRLAWNRIRILWPWIGYGIHRLPCQCLLCSWAKGLEDEEVLSIRKASAIWLDAGPRLWRMYCFSWPSLAVSSCKFVQSKSNETWLLITSHNFPYPGVKYCHPEHYTFKNEITQYLHTFALFNIPSPIFDRLARAPLQ